jgi:hypothetical protein
MASLLTAQFSTILYGANKPMDYILGAISLVSLALNYWIYRRVTASYSLGTVEELEPVTSHCCCEAVIEHLSSANQEESPLPPDPPKQNPDAHQAWVNRQGIPWVPPVKTPEPIIKTPDRGPLARPDGFV